MSVLSRNVGDDFSHVSNIGRLAFPIKTARRDHASTNAFHCRASPLENPVHKPLIELFSNIFSAERLKRIFFCVRIAFFPPYTERSIMTIRHYERHEVHPVRFA
jgi:hypothetical protein